MSGALRRRWRAVRRVPIGGWPVVAETAIMLALARLLVLAFPLHAVARRLATRPAISPVPPDRRDAAIAAVARRLPAIARALPFRALCLEQALAAALMLRRRGVATTLHLGTRREDGRFEAHAWLSVDGMVVVGGPTDGYRERTRF